MKAGSGIIFDDLFGDDEEDTGGQQDIRGSYSSRGSDFRIRSNPVKRVESSNIVLIYENQAVLHPYAADAGKG